jgi:hypothetical protein
MQKKTNTHTSVCVHTHIGVCVCVYMLAKKSTKQSLREDIFIISKFIL